MASPITLSFACFLILFPSIAVGQIIAVKVDDKDVVAAPGGGTLTLDVTLQDVSAVPSNDDLRGYDLPFVLERVGGGVSDLRFVPPYAEPPDSLIFTGPRTVFLVQIEQASGSGFTLNVSDPDATRVDVTRDPVGAARLVLEYGPVTSAAEYRIRLDPAFTIFGSGPDGPEVLFPDVSDVGIVRIVPEPTSVSLMAVCGLLAVRCPPRRRS